MNSFSTFIALWLFGVFDVGRGLRRVYAVSIGMAVLWGGILPSMVSAQEEETPEEAVEQPAQTGNGSLRGRVLNAETGQYVSLAQVRIEGTNLQAMTNNFGEYEFSRVPVGTVRVSVDFSGRETLIQDVTIAKGQTSERGFIFPRRSPLRGDTSTTGADSGDETVFELEALEVSGKDFQTATEIATQQERFSSTLRNVIDTDAFGLVPDGNVGEFVKYMPGVQVDYGSTYGVGSDAASISVRGFDSDQTGVTIDGIPVSSAVAGSLSRTVGLDTMSINNAARVEIIKVPTPDQPSASIGGTVNLVSKSAFEYAKPSLRFRIFTSINSNNFDDFWKKTPGPLDKSTYKVLPGIELSYAWPVNDKLGLSLTLAHSNSFSAGLKQKNSYVYDGTEVGPYRELDGTVLGELRVNDLDDDDGDGIPDRDDKDWDNDGRPNGTLVFDTDGDGIADQPDDDGDGIPDKAGMTYSSGGEGVLADVAHPFLNNVGVTDSPRATVRDSASFKIDYRPWKGHLFTVNLQYSTYESGQASRRFEMNAGVRNGGALSWGPDHLFGDIGSGTSNVNVTALDSIGDSMSGYLKWSYIKGAWDIKAHASYAVSNGNAESDTNGHFSEVALGMGNITLARYSEIKDGLPGQIEFYGYAPGMNRDDLPYSTTGPDRLALTDSAVLQGLVEDGILIERDPTKLENYGLSEVLTGSSFSRNTIKTYKFDIKRDLDFIPFDFMSASLKTGYYQEDRKDEKWGLGTGHKFVYTGDALDTDTIRDSNYIGVDPGFGFEPREWPDVYKLYKFFEDNRALFIDGSDLTDPTDPTEIGNETSPDSNGKFPDSLAAENWNSYVNTQKSVAEINDSYYVQLETKFFSNRLNIVGGFRQETRTLQGYAPFRNGDWRALRLPEDTDGDGVRDPLLVTLLDFETGLQEVELTNYRDAALMNSPFAIDPLGSGSFVMVSEAARRLGAVYNNPADQDPLVYDPINPLVPGTLAAAQLKNQPSRRIDGTSKGRLSPIISGVFELTDKISLRASWSQTYAKPPLEGTTGILRSYEISETDGGSPGTIKLSNPNLRPWASDNWDFSIGYYTDNGGKITLSYYMKSITDGHGTKVYDLSRADVAANEAEARALLERLGVVYESRFYSDGAQWSVEQAINLPGGGSTTGYEIELSQSFGFLGDWGRNLRVYFSMSDQTTNTDTVILASGESGSASVPFSPSVSKLALNGGVQFSYKKVSLRTNVTWRDEKLTRTARDWLYYDPTIADENPDDAYDRSEQVPIYYFNPAEMRVDLSFTYQLTKRYSLSISGRNITNSARENFIRGPYTPQYAKTVERDQFGVMWTFGLSGQF